MFRASLVRYASILLLMAGCISCNAAPKSPIPAPANDARLTQKPGKETAVFAGGCFWGTQSVFERVKGVVDTTAGYSGGSAATATYSQVGQENTGHAESVKVVYDPSKISYGRLLQIFFSVVHDPTQLNAAKVFPAPIVTEVTPLKGFYDAESYHQDYALYHPDNPYILVCDKPKVEALKAEFPELFQEYKGK